MLRKESLTKQTFFSAAQYNRSFDNRCHRVMTFHVPLQKIRNKKQKKSRRQSFRRVYK